MSRKPNARVVERSSESDPGRKRSVNQDRVFGEAPLFVVADGMGGHKGGEVAAALAVETFREKAELALHSDPAVALSTLVADANARIFRRAQDEPKLRGMGTTLTAALVHDDCVTIAHVGDSRAYRLRLGGLEQLTEDHSLVGDLIKLGAVSREEAEHHPQRSVVTRAVGTKPSVVADVKTHSAEDGDVYVLCSDGLTKMVSEARLCDIVAAPIALDETSDALIAAANEGGGDDNITVCLFRVAVPDATRKQTTVIDQSVIARVATAARPQRETD